MQEGCKIGLCLRTATSTVVDSPQSAWLFFLYTDGAQKNSLDLHVEKRALSFAYHNMICELSEGRHGKPHTSCVASYEVIALEQRDY